MQFTLTPASQKSPVTIDTDNLTQHPSREGSYQTKVGNRTLNLLLINEGSIGSDYLKLYMVDTETGCECGWLLRVDDEWLAHATTSADLMCEYNRLTGLGTDFRRRKLGIK